jgi:hypothetical protein
MTILNNVVGQPYINGFTYGDKTDKRSGTIVRAFTSQGKSSVKGNRQATDCISVMHEDGTVKTYHLNKIVIN